MAVSVWRRRERGALRVLRGRRAVRRRGGGRQLPAPLPAGRRGVRVRHAEGRILTAAAGRPADFPRATSPGGSVSGVSAMRPFVMKELAVALVLLVGVGGCSKGTGAAAAAKAPPAGDPASQPEPRVIESGEIDPAWLSYDAAPKTVNFHLIAC